MEDDDIGQCLLHFSVQDSGIGLSGTDRKNYLNHFLKVMPPLLVNLEEQVRAAFQTACSFDAWSNWL